MGKPVFRNRVGVRITSARNIKSLPTKCLINSRLVDKSSLTSQERQALSYFEAERKAREAVHLQTQQPAPLSTLIDEAIETIAISIFLLS